MNIPIAHIEGGDSTGSIDESVRHAITKFAHLHFVTNSDAARRVSSMGEDKRYIFDVGSPDVEIAEFLAKSEFPAFSVNDTGSGSSIDLQKKYLLVRFHPIWNEDKDETMLQTKALLDAVHMTGLQAIWFWPNDDTGGEVISQVLRTFNDSTEKHAIRFMRDLPPDIFMHLLAGASCMVGNSSAGVKECSFLGIPVVNTGSRQRGRLRGENVRESSYSPEEIQEAITVQARAGRFLQNKLYWKEGTARNIAEIAATSELYTQKRFHE